MKVTSVLGKSVLGLTTFVAIGAIASLPASAATFNFGNIFPTKEYSETTGDRYAGNFQLEVTDAGAGSVLFKFLNNGGNGALDSMFIGGVYFNQGAVGLISNILTNQGNVGLVNFSGDTGGNLAQGEKINFESAFYATKSGAARNSVQAGEALGIKFAGNYDAVVASMNKGELRVGMHVQGIDAEGYSDSFATVPEPFTMVGTAVGLGLVLKSRKRRQA